MKPLKQKRVMFVNGSIRKDKTSFQFASTLLNLTVEQGHRGELLHVIDFFEKPESILELKASLEAMDIVVLVVPLYVDTLPYIDLWFLEQLKLECSEFLTHKGLMVVAQCGFPDVNLNKSLLSSCRFFAQECGMNWLGGLSYGGGAALDGKALDDLGGRGLKIKKGFTLAIKSVLEGKTVPPEAQNLIELRIPKWLFKPLALYLNYNSRREGRRNGVYNLCATPYRMK